ncbi:hypothetical protein ACOSP7_024682 [Xanthoceras sorbifolium]
MEKARKNVNVDRTVASEAGKENVDPVLDNKVVGVVTRIKVILGMLDGNVKEGAHVAVTVKADYSDNAVTEERVGVKSQSAESVSSLEEAYLIS